MRLLPALAIGWLLAAPARCENPGVTGASVLQIPMGSRALGMGGAFSAVGTDASALYYNPAGMSRLNAHEVGFTMLTGMTDDTLQNIGYAGPTRFTGLSGNGYTSVGASLLFTQNGTIEVNKLNSDGSLQSSQNMSAGSDLVATLGYSERVGNTSLEIKDRAYGINHFIGAAGKIVNSRLAGGYSATSLAGDIGYLAHCPDTGLSLGLAILNAGQPMKFISESDPLPLTLRLGSAYQLNAPPVHSVVAAADGEYLLYERKWRMNFGLEYFWLRSYGMRLGYQFLQDALGLTVGFGARWRNRIIVDYAWGLASALRDTHRFTVSYRFGGVASAVRGRERQPIIDQFPDQDDFKKLEKANPPVQEEPKYRRPKGQGIPGWIY
ncbi:MAG: PorV/PorQ family protein [Elusimicrobiota bacterium]|jgi:hypothetical protein